MDEQNYILESEKKVLDIKGLPESLPKREINTRCNDNDGGSGGKKSRVSIEVGLVPQLSEACVGIAGPLMHYSLLINSVIANY